MGKVRRPRHEVQPESSHVLPSSAAPSFSAPLSRPDDGFRAPRGCSAPCAPFYPLGSFSTLWEEIPIVDTPDPRSLCHDPVPSPGLAPPVGGSQPGAGGPGGGRLRQLSSRGPAYRRLDNDHHPQPDRGGGSSRLQSWLGGVRACRVDVEHLRSDAYCDDGGPASAAGAAEPGRRSGQRDRCSRDVRSSPTSSDTDIDDCHCRRLRVQHVDLGLREDREAGAPHNEAGIRRSRVHPRIGGLGVEGLSTVAHRRALRPRLLILFGTAAFCLFSNTAAWADDSGGQYRTPSATGSVGAGGIQVGAGYGGSTATGAPSSDAATQGAGVLASTPGCGTTNVVLPPADQAVMGPGGPTPGVWEVPDCHGTGTWAAFWVPTGPAAAPQVSPAVLAQQARSELPLPAPAIEMAPPTDRDQLVNVSSWLWVDPAVWRSLSATATAGPLSATATAAPSEVVWQMGDGHTITCAGPGVPYDSSNPTATTYCSYTWPASSAGQPGGVYRVTATVYYQASWSASGAPGGGNFGLVAGPASTVAVRVAESQAINNEPGS